MNAPSGHVVAAAPRFFAERIALLFCAPMLVAGIALPYFPVWLNTLSLSDVEIGIVLAVPMIMRVVTAPIAGVIADRIGERTVVLVWSAILSFATALALFAADSFWPVLLLFSLQGAVFAPYMPIADAIALSGVRRWNFDYGTMRYWGSIAFIAATMVGGWLSGLYGGAMVLPAMAVSFALTIVTALLAPRIGRPRRPSPITALAVAPARTLRQTDVQLMLVGAAIVNASHAMLFAFSAIYWHGLGFSGTAIGLLWSAGVFAEVIVFVFARHIRRRVNLWTLIIAGSAVAIIRWIIFPVEMGFAGYLALQCSHAFTFACIHIGVQNRIVQRVDEEQEASAQGLYFLYNGLFMALATFFAGYVYTRYGIDGFYFMSLVAALGLVFVCAARLAESRAGGNPETGSI